MDKDGYPTEQELRMIRRWDIIKKGAKALVEYVQKKWWYPDWGFVLKGKRLLKLELHTGGWSGNESIIGALEENFFWNLYWVKSIRGGHYYFEIDLRKSHLWESKQKRGRRNE